MSTSAQTLKYTVQDGPKLQFQFWHELVILFSLAWPILLTQLSQSSVGIIDSIMVGKYGPSDLAAVAIGIGIWFPSLLMINGIMNAATVLVAEAKGGNQLHDIPIITQKAMVIGVTLGAIGMLFLSHANILFTPLQVPTHLQGKVTEYLEGVKWTLPALGFSTAFRSYTEGMGKPKAITFISFIGILLCIPLNHFFMAGYGSFKGYGGMGCGYSTSVIFWVLTLVTGTYLLTTPKYKEERLFQNFYWPNSKWTIHFLTIGLPIGITIFFEASLFSVAALILSPLGTKAVAAHQLALSISSIMFMVPLSLALAISIQTGQLYGAKNWSKLRFNTKISFIIATFISCINIAVILLFKNQLAHQYTQDEEVIRFASDLLLCVAMYQLFDAWQVSAGAILRGMQDTRMTMLLTLISYWVIAFPVGYYLARYTKLGALGFWMGLVLGIATAAFLLTSRLYSQLKKMDTSHHTNRKTAAYN